MHFIDPDYFEYEPTKISNIPENGDVRDSLARFIGKYEKQCLIEVLGECLYKEVIDSLELVADANAFTVKPKATNFIKQLINGHPYDAPKNSCKCQCNSGNCDKRYWKGFVETDEFFINGTVGKEKSSFIADYIHYHYFLENRSVTSGTGQQVLAGENSTTVFNESKRIDSYNRFITKINSCGQSTSLYQFLKDNIENYPTWEQNCSLKSILKY